MPGVKKQFVPQTMLDAAAARLGHAVPYDQLKEQVMLAGFDEFHSERSVRRPLGKVVCAVCGEYHTPGVGLRNHRQAKHPEATYHAVLIPTTRPPRKLYAPTECSLSVTSGNNGPQVRLTCLVNGKRREQIARDEARRSEAAEAARLARAADRVRRERELAAEKEHRQAERRRGSKGKRHNWSVKEKLEVRRWYDYCVVRCPATTATAHSRPHSYSRIDSPTI